MCKLAWQALVSGLFVSDSWKHSRQVVQQIYLLDKSKDSAFQQNARGELWMGVRLVQLERNNFSDEKCWEEKSGITKRGRKSGKLFCNRWRMYPYGFPHCFFSERQEFSINNIVWKIFDENLIKIILSKSKGLHFSKHQNEK